MTTIDEMVRAMMETETLMTVFFAEHYVALSDTQRNGHTLTFTLDDMDSNWTLRLDLTDSEVADVAAWSKCFSEQLEYGYLVVSVESFEDFDCDLVAYMDFLRDLEDRLDEMNDDLKKLAAETSRTAA